MRIISGKHKGKRIIAPKKLPVRPTTDFAKEALFNILNNRYDINELRILDLFTGTGNISYEFASRGARDIVSVDGHYACAKFVEETASVLAMPIKSIKSDVFKYLNVSREPYDIIFADPPYDFTLEQMGKLVSLCFDNDLLLQDGSLIIEHSKHLDLSGTEHFTEARKYGGSVFSFFGEE
jgi:16S rRNA (guanine(966)-N(2))-methyltransferase RsmD